MSSKIRVVQVGVGGRGKAFLNALRKSEQFEHVAFVDVNEAAVKAAREINPVPPERCFSDMGKAIEAVPCDAVFVITPPQLHARQCQLAIERGKHVLVEKPFTKSIDEARQVVQAAARQKVCVVVSQNARYAAIVQKARELLDGGGLGRLCAGMVMKAGFRGGVHHSGDDTHSYLWERGVHDLDTLLSLTAPRKARRVSARSFNPPFSPYKGGASACGWIEFDDGAVFALNLTFMSHITRNETILECEKGTLIVNSGLAIHRQKAPPEEVPVDGAAYKDSVACVLDGFYRYIREGKEPPISGRANLQTIEIIETLGRSSERNAVLELAGNA